MWHLLHWLWPPRHFRSKDKTSWIIQMSPRANLFSATGDSKLRRSMQKQAQVHNNESKGFLETSSIKRWVMFELLVRTTYNHTISSFNLVRFPEFNFCRNNWLVVNQKAPKVGSITDYWEHAYAGAGKIGRKFATKEIAVELLFAATTPFVQRITTKCSAMRRQRWHAKHSDPLLVWLGLTRLKKVFCCQKNY